MTKEKTKNKKTKVRDNKKAEFHEPFLRALHFSFSNIWRNKFISLATIVVMAILIFIFNIMLGINMVTQQALSDLSKKVDIIVYLKEDVEYYQVQQMINELKSLKGIVDVQYTSKTDALEFVSKTYPQTAEILDRYTIPNPLPASLSIRTEKPELHIMVQQFLNQEKYRHLLANVASGSEEKNLAMESVSKNLITLSNTTNQISFWILAVFILGSVLIISNSIQLTIYNRQREIYIMRLVGATKNYIRMPFLIEGLFYGVISMILGSVLIAIVYSQILSVNINITDYIKNIPFVSLFFIELGAIVVLGILCSFIAVYRYLRTKLILD
jgi:cell division transport system permease protein